MKDTLQATPYLQMEEERKWTGREASLVVLAGKQKMELGYQDREIEFTQRLLVKMVKDGRMTEAEVWAYMLEKPMSEMIRINSEALGIKTVIKEYTTQSRSYTNKKGEVKTTESKTFLVHYTIHGTYLGKVEPEEDGGNPKYYEGWFSLRQYKNEIEFKMNPNAVMMRDFFVGKGADEDDIPLATVKQIIRLKAGEKQELPLVQIKKLEKPKKK